MANMDALSLLQGLVIHNSKETPVEEQTCISSKESVRSPKVCY